jgi:hypothetical protein
MVMAHDEDRGAARSRGLSVFALIAVAVSACGGAVPGVRSDCPLGQTTLDGTCVSQPIADYVACIRATGATVASNSAKALSAAAGVAGVTASTQAEVQDKLEKSYEKVSDANVLEIIHDCRSKTAQPADTAGASSPSSSEMAVASPEGATVVPVAARAPSQAQAESGGKTAGAFAGNWVCVTKLSVIPYHGLTQQFDVSHPYVVVDNGDGTITAVNPNDQINPSCPPRPWPVSGSTAKPNPSDPPCFGNGKMTRVIGGDATVNGNRLTVNIKMEGLGGNNPGQVVVAAHCSR